MDKMVDGKRVALTPAEEAERVRIAALPRRRTKGAVRRDLVKLNAQVPSILAAMIESPGPMPPNVATAWLAAYNALKTELDTP